MSGIVIDLQVEAMNTDSDITSLLRKAYLVARKLNLNDFQKWIHNELNGYKDQNEIPSYRKVFGEVKGWNPYNGWIPVIIDDNEFNELLNSRKITDSIPKLQSLIGNENNVLTLSFPAEANAAIGRMAGFSSKYSLFISRDALNDIISKVQNSILEWSISLEENGIIGEGLKFTENEKDIAKNNVNINNYFNYFNGEVSDSQIQQGGTKTRQDRRNI